ncbi:hypothetical protein [Natrinema soli]|uniref:Xaa-Pro dipeptidyl-peptidase C-terminal domain-containing protein n=1 Tax=Natrinema soli TaxID=1930624 RepID=A0ABD5SNU9_9EURY|nr:hypothetical protein [Natrinema soli]
MEGEAGTATTSISWRRHPDVDDRKPVVRTVPYAEFVLEHPDLEPTTLNAEFFPDAVPYAESSRDRVFYWRPALRDSSPLATDWSFAYATTHDLVGRSEISVEIRGLTTELATGVAIVVDGTAGGDASMVHVRDYETPTPRIVDVTPDSLRLAVNGNDVEVAAGGRQRIELSPRTVEVIDEDELEEITPELSVRYPGSREIHHPAPNASDRLFPSFDLDLTSLSNPLAVPIRNGELDHIALATDLGVSLEERAYPERVLWQAFAYTAFDPRRESVPDIGRTDDDHLVVTAR